MVARSIIRASARAGVVVVAGWIPLRLLGVEARYLGELMRLSAFVPYLVSVIAASALVAAGARGGQWRRALKAGRWMAFGLCGLSLIVLVPQFFLASGERTRKCMSCETNVKILLNAIRMYAADWDDTLPLAETWRTATEPYAEGQDYAYVCPEAPELACGYALNPAVAGARLSTIDDHTVVLFESDRGVEAVGGRKSLPAHPRHKWGGIGREGRDVYGFLDAAHREGVRVACLSRHRPRLAESVRWTLR